MDFCKALDGTAELFLRMYLKKIKERIKWHTVEDSADQEARAKCTRLLAQAARPSVKFPSSLPKADLFTAGIASRSREGTENP